MRTASSLYFHKDIEYTIKVIDSGFVQVLAVAPVYHFSRRVNNCAVRVRLIFQDAPRGSGFCSLLVRPEKLA